jgi:four helix bundle protein
MAKMVETKRMKYHDYKKLVVWQVAVDLAVDVFKVSADFPKSELYGLTSQIRRSAVSIPSNIAEGAGRNSDKYFSQFLSISYGSACELETQLLIAHQLNFITEEILTSILEKVGQVQKMAFKLNLSINSGE